MQGLGPSLELLSAPNRPGLLQETTCHQFLCLVAARSYNKTNHVPGPGRGIHEPTTRASALIKAEQINLAKALVDGLISSDFQSAEEIYEKAFAVTEHHSQLAGSKIDEALRAAVQLTVRGRKDPIQQRSDRQVRRHKAAVKLAIMEQAGTRPEDQIAIAQAVLADLQGSLSSQQQKTASQIMQEDMKSKHDKEAKDFIIKRVQKTIALLKSKIPKGGRRTHADRTVMQTVVGATMREVPPGLQQAACRILDVDRRHVPLLRNLWDNYEASNEPTAVPFIQKEQGGKKPYQEEYAEFVVSRWYELTRRSERMQDEVRQRNPE